MIKTKRNLPYGYLMENGKIVFDPVESQIVTNIYQSYTQDECSFADIAACLNSKSVIYSEDRPKWDKNKIARIIGDRRYVGEKDYPELIPTEILETAEKKRMSRQVYDNEKKKGAISFTKLKTRIACGECGGLMRRRHETTLVTKDRWYCIEEACNTVIPVEDEDFNKSVLLILNQLITSGCVLSNSNEGTVPKYETNSEVSAEIRKLDSEIKRLLDAVSLDKENLKQLMLEAASMKYNALSANEVKTELMKADLVREGRLSALSREVMNKFVNEIRLFQDGMIELILINGWTLREDTEYGNDDTDFIEARSCNTA